MMIFCFFFFFSQDFFKNSFWFDKRELENETTKKNTLIDSRRFLEIYELLKKDKFLN